jgi:hypothetical protein
MSKHNRLVRRRTVAIGASAFLLLATISSVVTGAGPVPGLGGKTTATGLDPAAIVRVDVAGTDNDGQAVSASAYGVVVDSSGLVMAPASVVAPRSTGVAVGWQWPFLGYDVDSITVKPVVGTGGTAPVGPSAVAYSGTVAAADGLLDVAIIRLDKVVTPTGASQPIPAGSLNLPAMSVAAADPPQGAAVSFATYVDSGTTPVGAGTFTELPGTVVGWASDDHVPSPNVWLNTDVTTPVAFPGGAVVDDSGAIVALGIWLAGNPSEHVYGPTASLIAPVLAAAKSGTEYETPFIVAGTGQERAEVTGWGEGEDPCSTSPQLTAYPAGANRIAANFSYSGFTDGEDWYRLWFDPDEQQLIAAGTSQWSNGQSGDCSWVSLTSKNEGFTNGRYGVNIFAGGDLHYVVGAITKVGGGGTGGNTVPVTGRVVDSDTGKGVIFAFVYLLKPGTDLQEWINGGGTDADIATSGITDDKGRYTTDPPITPGEYPFLVIPSDNHQAVGGTVRVPENGKLPDIVLTPGT